jgi:RNA polymerase sigma factor (sigma-70 family)
MQARAIVRLKYPCYAIPLQTRKAIGGSNISAAQQSAIRWWSSIWRPEPILFRNVLIRIMFEGDIMSDANAMQVATASLTDAAFKNELARVIPQLRAFGRSLCGNHDLADDLVQETMLKAWAARNRYMAGTNFRAWTFTILRNHYFSLTRRLRFTGEWDDLVADRVLASPASQDTSIELRDLMRALTQLPEPQREALILVGAGGISYEETAKITGVAVGTVKSRVARARMALEALMNGGVLETARSDFDNEEDAVVSIFAYLDRIQTRQAARPGVPGLLALAA